MFAFADTLIGSTTGTHNAQTANQIKMVACGISTEVTGKDLHTNIQTL